MDCNDFFTKIGFYFDEHEDENEDGSVRLSAEFIFLDDSYTISNPKIAKMIVENKKFKKAWQYIAEQLTEIKLED